MHSVAFEYASTYLSDAAVPLSTVPGRAHAVGGQWTTYHGCHRRSVPTFIALSVAGPQAWNQPPITVRQKDCVATFKRYLKTKLCRLITFSQTLVFLKFYRVLWYVVRFSTAVQLCERRYTSYTL